MNIEELKDLKRCVDSGVLIAKAQWIRVLDTAIELWAKQSNDKDSFCEDQDAYHAFIKKVDDDSRTSRNEQLNSNWGDAMEEASIKPSQPDIETTEGLHAALDASIDRAGIGQPSMLPPSDNLVRYCPECNHIGEVDESSKDCCRDDKKAYRVPIEFAKQCAMTFMHAIRQLNVWKAETHIQALTDTRIHPVTIPMWFNGASAIANIRRLEYIYDPGHANATGMFDDPKGSFVRYADVCAAFGIEP